jgi:hypothetical protein
MFATIVYSLCALTSLLCVVLLSRAYLLSRSRVLFWSSLCFMGLLLANVVLVLDKLVYTEIDLLPVRLWITLVALALLLFGLLYASD